jgi:hypothetical protein
MKIAGLFTIKFIFLLCLTLGLAPFFPEPHIWGKLKWIAGGANGMQAIDWFDTLFHGAPWIILLVYLVVFLFRKLKN